MPLSTDQFRDHLTASGLLSADDVSALLAVLPEDKQPQDADTLETVHQLLAEHERAHAVSPEAPRARPLFEQLE